MTQNNDYQDKCDEENNNNNYLIEIKNFIQNEYIKKKYIHRYDDNNDDENCAKNIQKTISLNELSPRHGSQKMIIFEQEKDFLL